MSNRAGVLDLLSGRGHGLRGVAAIILVAILCNLVSIVLEIRSGGNPWVLLAIVCAIVLALVAISRLPGRPPVVYVTDREKPQPHKGLVVLVSKGRVDRKPSDQSARDAIAYHANPGASGQRLQHCWLIATRGKEGSLPYAQELKGYCDGLGVEADIEQVDDGFSVQATHDLISRIYAEATEKTGIAPEDIISDFTGGVKPMSAGVVLACGDRYPMQYMYGGQPDIASVPRRIEFRSRITEQRPDGSPGRD